MFWLFNLAIVIGIGVYVYLFAVSRITPQSARIVNGHVPTPTDLKGPDGPAGPNGTLKDLPQKEQDDLRNKVIKRRQLRDQMLGFVEQYVLPALLVLTWVYGLRIFDLKYSILLGSVLAMTYVVWKKDATTGSNQEVIFHLLWVIVTVYIFSRYGMTWAALIPFGIVIASFAPKGQPVEPVAQLDSQSVPEQKPDSLYSLLFLLGLTLLVVSAQQAYAYVSTLPTLETRIQTLQKTMNP